MKITAMDADEPGNVNSLIAYTIIDQSPAHDMFDISNDGTIYVKQGTLDREVWAKSNVFIIVRWDVWL